MEIGAPVYITDESIVIIDCSINRGIPPITLSWFHNNIIDQSRRNMSSIVVMINSAADIHRHVYSCKAENERGSDIVNTTMFYVKKKFCIIP